MASFGFNSYSANSPWSAPLQPQSTSTTSSVNTIPESRSSAFFSEKMTHLHPGYASMFSSRVPTLPPYTANPPQLYPPPMFNPYASEPINYSFQPFPMEPMGFPGGAPPGVDLSKLAPPPPPGIGTQNQGIAVPPGFGAKEKLVKYLYSKFLRVF